LLFSSMLIPTVYAERDSSVDTQLRWCCQTIHSTYSKEVIQIISDGYRAKFNTF
jgi:hypothetical protein